MFIKEERERLHLWNAPRREGLNFVLKKNERKMYKMHQFKLFYLAWQIHPHLALSFYERFKCLDNKQILIRLLRRYSEKEPLQLLGRKDALSVILKNMEYCREQVKIGKEILSNLIYLQYQQGPNILEMITHYGEGIPQELKSYSLKTLYRAPEQIILFYLPQLLQCCLWLNENLDENSLPDRFSIQHFLIESAKCFRSVSDQLIWLCEVEGNASLNERIGAAAHASGCKKNWFCKYICRCIPVRPHFVDEKLQRLRVLTKRLQKYIKENMSQEENKLFQTQNKLVNQILSISSNLRPREHYEESKVLLKQQLKDLNSEINFEQNFYYVPIKTNAKIKRIIHEKAVALKSQDRVPCIVTFLVQNDQIESPGIKRKTKIKIEDPKKVQEQRLLLKDRKSSQTLFSFNNSSNVLALNENLTQPDQEEEIDVIFKANDDVRVDQLALQLINVIKDIFDSAGLPLRLIPYKIISCIGKNQEDKDLIGGIIQPIPRVKSRDQIGREFPNLLQYFIHTFGAEGTESFERARLKFIETFAAYAIVCYVFAIKDRHNGNILISEDGSMIHIDFSFMLGSSPAGDLGWESAVFKYTEEMDVVMGSGSRQWSSQGQNYFIELLLRGLLAVREKADNFISIVKLMSSSEYQCYRPDSIEKMYKRLMLTVPTKLAVISFRKQINSARQNWRTKTYDLLQWFRNRINY